MNTSGMDFTGPNIACAVDVLAGGRDNYAADREEAGRLLVICPSLRDVVRENRVFIVRAVTWAAQQGIGQFADLGTGLPALSPVGDAARTVIPDARIAYIDHDPLVIAHVQARLAASDAAAAAAADLTDPAAVLAHPDVRAVIDPAKPACLVLGLVLNLLSARQAREVMAGFADLVAPGSCVVISCEQCDDEVLWKQLSEACTAADLYNHSPGEVEDFLAGLELVPPGVVAAPNWRGGWHDVPAGSPGPAYVLAGVARKPY